MIKTASYLPKLTFISAIFIFGTIGIFRKSIPIPSGALAMLRGLLGAALIVIVLLIARKKPQLKKIGKKLIALIISGGLIGFNWILLFEAYNYTTVATATLSYYMAPVFVIFASPIFLKESLTLKQIICSASALIGMIFVSGVLDVGFSNLTELIGIALGLGAAALYATVIIINKSLNGVDPLERTVVQLASAGITILPYVIFVEDLSKIEFNATLILMIILVGVIHTGVAYTLYFGSINKLSAHSVAIYSYIDPVVAIILSALLLDETLTPLATVGAVIVLGSTLINELNFKIKARR